MDSEVRGAFMAIVGEDDVTDALIDLLRDVHEMIT